MKECYSHDEFHSLAESLGDRGDVCSMFCNKSVIATMMKRLSREKNVTENWDLILEAEDSEIHMDLQSPLGDHRSDAPTSNADLGELSVSPQPRIQKKQDAGDTRLSVACPQRLFDWDIQAEPKARGAGSNGDTYGDLIRGVQVSGNTLSDGYGKYPPVKIDKATRAGVVSVVLGRHLQIALPISKLFMDITLNRRWEKIGDLSNDAQVSCRFTMLMESGHIARRDDVEGLLAAVEEVQCFLDNMTRTAEIFDAKSGG